MNKQIGSIIGLIIVSLVLTVAADLLPLGMLTSSSPDTDKVVALNAVTADFVSQGKSALNNHMILSARDLFHQAVSADPANQEAQLFYGLSRLFALYEDGQSGSTTGLDSVREIMERCGIIFQSFGLYNTTYTKPDKPAVTTPRTGEVIDFLETRVLTEVDGAIANLEAVTNQSFVSTLSPAAFGKSSGNTLVIDYADVLALKSFIYALKCNVELLLVYNLDITIPQIIDDPHQLLTYKKFFQNDISLLTPKDPNRLNTAKGALVSFIDIFTTATYKVSSRTDTLPHLFVVDAPLISGSVHTKSKVLANIRDALAQVKASIDGPIKYTFATIPQVDLSKFFDSISPLNIRAKLGNTTMAIPDPTLNGLFPQGLDLVKLRQKYGEDVLGVLFTGMEKPMIAVTPSVVILREYGGSATVTQSFTISNTGTGQLLISDMHLETGDFKALRLSFGTCGSNTPSIAAGGSCTATLSFIHPAVAGSKQSILRITSNDSSTPVITRNILGYTSGGGSDLMIRGDINGDKTVNVFDALLTLQFAVGLVEHTTENTTKYLATADVAPLDATGKPKGDTVVNVFDALAILRHAVGLDAW